MHYRRMPIEVESPEEVGYGNIRFNLAESSVRDLRWSNLGFDLGDPVLWYGDHRGLPELREQIVAGADELGPGHVLAAPGAVAALFCIHTALLKAGDHCLVVHPNYATNVETPRAIGADVEYVRLRFEDGWQLHADALAERMRAETKLVSLTVPHNPTGAVMPRAELERIIALAESHGCHVLLDETYRELTHDAMLPMGASLSERVISVSSMSKSYGLPGIRMGWMITRDERLLETLLAAKEQIFICNSVLDETIAARVLAEREQHLQRWHAHLHEAVSILDDWMLGQSMVEWVRPAGGVVCCPRIQEDAPVNIDRFYQVLNETHGTFVGPGHWFEMDRRYMRIGYGWPTLDELRGGLAAVSEAAAEAAA